MLWDIDLIFGIWNYNDELQIIKLSRFVQAILFPWINLVNFRRLEDTDLEQYFVIRSLLLRELKKDETYASLLNIHGGNIRVVPTHLVFSWGVIFISDMSWTQHTLWDKYSIHCLFVCHLFTKTTQPYSSSLHKHVEICIMCMFLSIYR